jgi:hypothetical protein
MHEITSETASSAGERCASGKHPIVGRERALPEQAISDRREQRAAAALQAEAAFMRHELREATLMRVGLP